MERATLLRGHRQEDPAGIFVRKCCFPTARYVWLLIVFAILLTLSLLVKTTPPYSSMPVDPYLRARALMYRRPLIDTHNDLPFQLRIFSNGSVFGENAPNLLVNQSNYFNTDIVRLKDGLVGAQFWSVYVPCFTQGKDAVRSTMEQIDIVYQLVQRYSSYFKLALTVADIEKNFADGYISCLIGMEGGHSIDNSVAALRRFYNDGVRYMTLTHECHTDWADSCKPPSMAHPPSGLTEFGVGIVHEMNRIGMMVDISHVSHATMRTVLNVTKAPVIFSHSSVYALCNNSRNVPDDVLKLLKATGIDGVVMINFFNRFIRCNPPTTVRVADVADHIEYIRNLIGVEYVGLGSDFDGVENQLPIGLTDVSMYPNLIAELLTRGYSDDDVTAIFGGNLLRVMKKVETVAQQLQLSNSEPFETKHFVPDYCVSNFTQWKDS